MAKKKDVNIDELDDESGKSGKLVSILVAMLIIVIWLVIFALLIKMNVGGIGSSLRPYLKNVPVVNKILPAATDVEIQEETGGKYKSLSEAVDRINLKHSLMRTIIMGMHQPRQLLSFRLRLPDSKCLKRMHSIIRNLKISSIQMLYIQIMLQI